MPTDDLADYLNDNYGFCTLKQCQCRPTPGKPHPAWMGRRCAAWRPAPASNWAELEETMRAYYGYPKGDDPVACQTDDPRAGSGGELVAGPGNAPGTPGL